MRKGVGSTTTPYPRKEEIKAVVLEALTTRFEFKGACEVAGIDTKTLYRWRKEDPEFEKACMAAQGEALEVLVTSVYDRALNKDGKYDERTAAILAMFVIKAHRSQYKDSYKAEVDVGPINFTFQIPKPEGLMAVRTEALPEHVIDGEVTE